MTKRIAEELARLNKQYQASKVGLEARTRMQNERELTATREKRDKLVYDLSLDGFPKLRISQKGLKHNGSRKEFRIIHEQQPNTAHRWPRQSPSRVRHSSRRLTNSMTKRSE